MFGTVEDWIAATIANVIGGLIFFWVDRFIFYHKMNIPIWEVRENITCIDCEKPSSRGYRLLQTPNGYNKLDDINPQFRCELCSSIKFKRMNKL